MTYGKGDNLDLFGGPPKPPPRKSRKGREVPAALQTEEEKAAGLEGALLSLWRARRSLIQLGYELAIAHWGKHGEVCSNDVWKRLWKMAETDALLKTQLQTLDERWIGHVFMTRRGWIWVREIKEGSHKRGIPVWTRMQTKVKKRRKR